LLRQIGVEPAQSELVKQLTQIPVCKLQNGWPGRKAKQSVSDLQPRHVLLVSSQIGESAGQSGLVKQTTHVPAFEPIRVHLGRPGLLASQSGSLLHGEH